MGQHNPPQPLTVDGVTYPSLTVAAKHFGVAKSTLLKRLERGFSPEQSVRGEGTGNKHELLTRCRRGHPMAGLNLIIRDGNNGQLQRVCRECRNRQAREWKRKRRHGAG